MRLHLNIITKHIDGGKLVSDAWVRLWVNDKLVVNFTGPCGRNDNGRVPYFKMGPFVYAAVNRYFLSRKFVDTIVKQNIFVIF